MPDVIKIKKGLNIQLKGKAEKIFIKAPRSETYAVKPPDFHGITPKMMVNVDEQVKAGSPLFFDKANPEVLFTSPVSGKIVAINRGERRRILEVVIKADETFEHESFGKIDLDKATREEICSYLLKSGAWPFILQRPYAIIANPHDKPKAIFISGFDSAPLAPDYDFLLKESKEEFQAGINVLSKLTEGTVHLNLNGEFPVAPVFSGLKNARVNLFKGPHPAGTVGVQMNKLDPVNKGEVVWYVNPQDVAMIGRLMGKGMYDASKIVAFTGSDAETPRYYKTVAGASIKSITEGNVTIGDTRYISGNVLTGTKVNVDGYLGFYDSQITVIPEGNYYEFFGWAGPGIKKFSMSKSFFSWLFPGKEYKIDTNLHGGRRAFVMSDQYTKVCPMDIYPVQLIKAILIEDIDLMEKLGIYEVAEEDLALCEFVCTSKIEVQSILRKGLDMMRKEMS